MERFVGKIAVVTGASSGIGKAIAKELLKYGVNVVGLGRNITAPLQDIAEEVSKDKSTYSGQFYWFQCDIAKETEVRNTFQKIITELGPIWILVNNAGSSIPTLLHEMNADDFNVFTPYTEGTIFCSQEVVKCMVDNSIEGGHILNIVSITDRLGNIDFPELKLTVASKHAQRSLSEGLRREITKRKFKIKISNIDPGTVLTKLAEPYFKGLTSMDLLNVEEVARACVSILNTPINLVVTELTLVPTHDHFL